MDYNMSILTHFKLFFMQLRRIRRISDLSILILYGFPSLFLYSLAIWLGGLGNLFRVVPQA